MWPEHRLQVSAYAHSDWAQAYDADSGFLGRGVKWHLGILQVGYRRNKAGWKLTEVEDAFAFARLSPFPGDEELAAHLYAGGTN